MDSFQFELVSPEKLLISEEVQHVVVPGVEGEFGVLAHHAPLLSVLRPGVVQVFKAEGGEPERLFVKGGFADVNPKGLTILADEAMPMSEFDVAKLDAAIKDAEEDLADAEGEESKRRAREKVDQLKEFRAVVA
ncbi:F0F1 ATP synthase subunit epsilon [Chenggangzhangella methanolivorans]|uniref:ATP synthase epsilon chain n=1 Tax=Chenggangzhangella methanolivorans TaxID=1437009 RepID=A0A9E6RDT4_9HYPH|nr:F0F1 ATP synthase subunit epsilon [Chenggangzhangella methanolivorans]QZO01513.1 F0F1 ATP synthase subunit epsilon [Chenggangzhangella methanolivorans]